MQAASEMVNCTNHLDVNCIMCVGNKTYRQQSQSLEKKKHDFSSEIMDLNDCENMTNDLHIKLYDC